ncbi:MAG: hypothetical protein HPPSJP_1180 [Candidatus Hepatoplasma scabrum]|nr:MAG: hypothetical protein HPPSJP_1180 [Candidatus Hepatoplasma sp.]
MELDKFYTNPKIIKGLIEKIDKRLKGVGLNFSDFIWIEPSAGSGNFIDALKKYSKKINPKIKIKAYDIEPHGNIKFIEKINFLELKSEYSSKNIIFGNPPFGKRSKLAIDFINKSSEFADIIAFILPNQFKRYLTQNKINPNLKLISQFKITEDSFLVNDRAYNVNCVFQIWVSKNRIEFEKIKDKRIYKSSKIRISDLDTFIYNNTKETRKYFNKNIYKWDFAVHRQGYYDYSELIEDEKKLNKKRQYFFIKCKNENCKNIVRKIDFKSISKSNTSIPGYSTSDFIKIYKKTKKDNNKNNNDFK